MAELNLNYDPAWLQQRPDSNQPMSLAEAFQLKQRQQHLDTEKALLPLRQQEMQARVANQALELKINQDKMALALKMKAADAAGWEALSKVDNILDPAQVAPIYAEGAKAGGYSSSFTTFLENIQQNAQMTNVRAMEAQARALEAASRVRSEAKPTAVVQTVLEADKMEQEAIQAEASGDISTATRLRGNVELLRGSVKGSQEATQVFDVNGNLMFSQTKGGGMPQGITPGLQTTAQKDILNNKKAFDIAHDLESSIDPSSVGLIGVASNLIFDKALAQIDPSLANNKRIDDRTKLTIARAQMVRIINSDSRFSNADRLEAEDAVPSKGVVESHPDIQQKLKTLQNIFKRRSYQDSISQGVPPPYWSMPTQDEVVTMFKKKKSELLKAVQEGKMKAPAANTAILREQADAQEVLWEQYGIPPRAPTP